MSGGKREGAGRPPIDPQMVKVPVGYKLPRWLVEWLRIQEEPAAQLIEDALRKQHKLKAPNAPHEGPGGFSPGPLDAVVGPQTNG